MIESERSFIKPSDFWRGDVYSSSEIEQYYITPSDTVKFTCIKQGDDKPENLPFISLPEIPPELQLLITTDGMTSTIRLRKRDNIFIFTKKINISDISSLEIEYEIDKTEFYSIAKMAQSNLKKTRHLVKYGRLVLEIDEYVTNEAVPRTRLEVEYPTEAEAIAFNAPPEFGIEVTHVKGHANMHYAERGFKHWDEL
jgi:CYTH domain-containing protein